MMPNTNEYCSQLISTLMSRPDLVTVPKSLQKPENTNKEDEIVDDKAMETDDLEESDVQPFKKEVENDFVLDKTNYESFKNAFDSVCLS